MTLSPSELSRIDLLPSDILVDLKYADGMVLFDVGKYSILNTLWNSAMMLGMHVTSGSVRVNA